jgi:hypothetical protein
MESKARMGGIAGTVNVWTIDGSLFILEEAPPCVEPQAFPLCHSHGKVCSRTLPHGLQKRRIGQPFA